MPRRNMHRECAAERKCFGVPFAQTEFASRHFCDNEAMELPTVSMVDAATRTAVESFIARLTGRFAVREALLFGSRARGEARPDSDADVAVVLEGMSGAFVDIKLAMADAAFDNLLETGILIQPLPLWEGEWRNPSAWRNPELLRNIENHGIRVWPTSAN